MQSLFRLFCLLLLVFFCGCTQKKSLSGASPLYFRQADSGVQTGGIQFIPIQTPKGVFKVWTKSFGHNPGIKVLLLNGGPGGTHEYFEALESYFPAAGIEFIYYDQLGCGNSDNPEDTALWDLPRYVEEVEQIRSALKLDKNNFYLLGHSWGGILAMQYALKYQHHLKGLVISNMMASCPAYARYAREVLAPQMNQGVLAEIRSMESKKQFTHPRYMELLMPHFYERHILRMPAAAWPDPVNRMFKKMNQSLYVTMQGPSEFGITGKLEKWDVTPYLKTLTVPTLTIGARYDTMDPEHMKWMAAEVQNGSYLFCPEGSHCALYDDQRVYTSGLTRFILAVNKGEKKAILP